MNKTTQYQKVDVKERASQFIDRLLDHLQNGDILTWKKTWKAFTKSNEFCNAVHKNGYKGSNVLRVYLDCVVNGYQETRYLTYNQIKNLAKDNNRKGFLSGENCKKYINLYFSFPKIVKDKDPNTGQEVDKFIGMFWSQTENLFNLDLTDLGDLFPIEKEKTDTPKPLTEREKNALAILNSPYLAPFSESKQDQAFYVPSLDTIMVPQMQQFNTNPAFIGTLAHEQAHATGHKTRCNRNLTGSKGGKLYAKEELVAELTAFMFGSQFEIELEDNSMAYVLGWLKRVRDENSADVIFSALGHAHKAFEFIMTGKLPAIPEKDN